MTRYAGVIASLVWFILTPYTFAGGKKAPTPSLSPAPMASTQPSPSPSPISSNKPGIPGKIGFQCVTCTESEKAKVSLAEKRANFLVQAPCFEKFMLKWGLLWTNGKTPAQVVAQIRNANLTVPVHFYMGNCGVAGYRNPGAPDVYFNRCAHNGYTVDETASNATHEWSHVLGYDHPYRRKSWRGQTVPYAINHAFEDKSGCLGVQ